LVALFKRAIVRSLFWLLFSKERLCYHSFSCSFQKSDCAIALLLLFSKERLCDSSFVALFKRATKKAIAQLLF